MSYRWVQATGGRIPDGAAANGRDTNGQALFVARAFINNGLHPGKVRAEFGAANIPYAGKEEKIINYEVLMNPGVWVPASGGKVPDGAVVAGFEPNGEPLFVARAEYSGGIHPGKVRLEFRGANIGYADREIRVDNYEVLVAN